MHYLHRTSGMLVKRATAVCANVSHQGSSGKREGQRLRIVAHSERDILSGQLTLVHLVHVTAQFSGFKFVENRAGHIMSSHPLALFDTRIEIMQHFL